MPHAFAKTLKTFKTKSGKEGKFFSLPALAKQYPGVERLPVSIRIVLESVLRNCDGQKVTAEHVAQLAKWGATAERTDEIPFVVARVVLQDFTGVPLLADLAAMRNVAEKLGKNPKRIEPLVPVDLVVDSCEQLVGPHGPPQQQRDRLPAHAGRQPLPGIQHQRRCFGRIALRQSVQNSLAQSGTRLRRDDGHELRENFGSTGQPGELSGRACARVVIKLSIGDLRQQCLLDFLEPGRKCLPDLPAIREFY